jgi:hypothetical protein
MHRCEYPLPMPFDEALPTEQERARWLERIGDADAYQEIVRDLACLHTVDVEAGLEPKVATGWLRVAAWNVERGRDPAAIAQLIASTGADVALLTEVQVTLSGYRLDVGLPAVHASTFRVDSSHGLTTKSQCRYGTSKWPGSSRSSTRPSFQLSG